MLIMYLQVVEDHGVIRLDHPLLQNRDVISALVSFVQIIEIPRTNLTVKDVH